jgi:hypothetical protein
LKPETPDDELKFNAAHEEMAGGESKSYRNNTNKRVLSLLLHSNYECVTEWFSS